MQKRVLHVEHTSLHTYGVCCSGKSACPLSYESDEFVLIAQLLQTPEGSATFQARIAEFTRFFQHNTAICSVCHQPVAGTATQTLGNGVDAKRLQRVLRLRNQLVGLEILHS